MTLKWMTINSNHANGIYGEDLTTLVLEDTTESGNGTDEVSAPDILNAYAPVAELAPYEVLIVRLGG